MANLASLKIDAWGMAHEKGHDMQAWISKGRHDAKSYCGECGMRADVDTYPATGKYWISGDATIEECKG